MLFVVHKLANIVIFIKEIITKMPKGADKRKKEKKNEMKRAMMQSIN